MAGPVASRCNNQDSKNGEKYDACAGFRRNEEPSMQRALLRPGDGRSPGTRDMIELADKFKLPRYVLTIWRVCSF